MDPIAELEKRIEENKRLVSEQEQALAVLKKAFGISAANTKTQAVITKNSEVNDVFSFGDLIAPTNKRNTFLDDIKSVISQFASNEFSVVHVEAALKRKGIEINGKSPRARISLALAKLMDDKFVEKVFDGSGNIPHRYRLKGETPVVAGVPNVTMSLAG